MLDEIESLLKNETWTFESLPPGRSTVKNKWVFRVKVKSDGTIERFKARLVAKGFTQTHGMDYTETFAPTARAESIRIVLSIVGAEGLFMIQFDIKTTYLNSTIAEVIYMDIPVGFEEYFHKRFPGCRGKVCRILKLKDSMDSSSLPEGGIRLFRIFCESMLSYRVPPIPVFSFLRSLLVSSSPFGLMMALLHAVIRLCS